MGLRIVVLSLLVAANAATYVPAAYAASAGGYRCYRVCTAYAKGAPGTFAGRCLRWERRCGWSGGNSRPR
jgi:hypothetical protein